VAAHPFGDVVPRHTAASHVFRETFDLAATSSAVDGIWLGSRQFQGRSVRTKLIVESGTKGEQRCT